jgi:hypothetical protein
MEVRAADATDLPFLSSMLACAAHWGEGPAFAPSLSAEADSPALRLYEDAGFEPVAESGAPTMLLRLS